MKLTKESCTLPPWHKEPLHLTQEQINDPMMVLREFFAINALPDLRRMMKDWFTDTLDDREDMPAYIFWLYDDLLPVLEAASVLCREESR
ncbi:hypothetical protein ACTHGU_09595 [Chitinophagaceae bacterium MMS25-I14]